MTSEQTTTGKKDRQKKLAIYAIILGAIAGAVSNIPLSSGSKETMYDNPTYWYDNGRVKDESLADVFYVLPTCVHDWTDSTGTLCHHASLTDAKQRERMLPSFQLADDIFADSANFFAPYYRHISLEAWMGGPDTIASCFPRAMNDVRNAFHHYLKVWNNSRPFILAGYSQGAKCVIELLKELDDETASHLIAAYVCGFKITPDDTASTPYLRKAEKSNDTGVTINYNTVSDTAAIISELTGNSLYIINPASWTTDTREQQLNDTVTIQIDSTHNVLVAKGVDPMSVYRPKLDKLAPKGNLHMMELTLYHDQLQQNVKQRIRAFTQEK